MGSASSKNIIKAVNDVAISSVMQVVQDNSVAVGGENNFVIGPGCSGSTLKDIQQSITISVNVSAVQAAINSPNFTTSLQNSINQIAQASAAALNPGKAKAQNVADAINKYSAKILATFTQNCNFSGVLGNSFTCAGSGVNVSGVTQTAALNLVSSCVQKATNDPALETELSNAIKQTASAKTESLLGPLLLIVAVIGATIVAFFAFGGKSVGQVFSTPWPWVTGLGLAGAYTGVRWYTKTGLFAYKPKVSPYPSCGLSGTPDPQGAPCSGPQGTCNPRPPAGAYKPCPCPKGATTTQVVCEVDPTTGQPRTVSVPCSSNGYTQADIAKACGTSNVALLHY